jgi:hypothetical protein
MDRFLGSANVPAPHEIEVVDREKEVVLAKWRIGEAGGNFPMASEDSSARLFIGC